MSEISRLIRFLIDSGFPWFALILIVALALWLLRPIHVSLSLGDRGGKPHDKAR